MSTTSNGPRVGLILSGCGVSDGSEIHEATSALIHLARAGAQITYMAPNREFDTIDHAKGEPSGEKRNTLVEAARIARGKITDLAQVKGDAYDAFVLPGGFGAAKNLSTFATQGADCTVDEQVARVLTEAHAAGKPIGFICIAPTIGAKLFGQHSVRLTIGKDAGTAGKIEAMGATHVDADRTEIVVDDANRVVSTPAYMHGDSNPAQVYEGIGNLVKKVVEMTGAATPA